MSNLTQKENTQWKTQNIQLNRKALNIDASLIFKVNVMHFQAVL